MLVERFFCFRLNTAGLVLGWFGGISSILKIIAYAILITKLDTIVNGFVNEDKLQDVETLKSVVLTFLIIYIAMTALDCLASILLIAGTLKEKHLLLVPWLINNAILIALNTLKYGGTVFMMFKRKESFWITFAVLAIGFLFVFVQYYAWIAIRSLYKVFQISTEHERLIQCRSIGKFQAGPPSYTRI